ncbi:DUF1853 family protein [Cupriavidus gilardii]|uniref:DUF1853 family protein n=1 Tax=Cupriavidus gilardii TaxID=82541 RepID=UPI0021BEF645|nr:DUF1853 family protein [Cupriavidus gilardii]MCT9127423.1 DUF1853 family protein [Cupriavidus gilardii]
MREPVTELAGAGATTAEPLWRAATSARVRDLAWCTLAPPLLSGLPRDVAALAALAEGGGAALASWPPAALAAWQRWLAAADPRQLPPTIEELSALPGAVQALAPAARSLRLGRHAERLLHFALEHGDGIELVASNLPVRRHGAHGVQTLGELDFVWRESAGSSGGAGNTAGAGQLVHWEMAAKFYLLVEPGGDAPDAAAPAERTAWLQAFVGPNLVDRLGDKLSHIVRRQLPLSRTPEAEALLGGRVDRSEIYLLGWLFYRDGRMPAGLDALGLNPAHLRGWWSTLEQWAQRVGGSASSASAAPVRWHRLPRARWLSPALVPEHDTEPFETLHDALAARFAEPHRDLAWRRESPVMICEMEPAGASAPGWWRERSRGFVVPPGWEERARQRIAQPPR